MTLVSVCVTHDDIRRGRAHDCRRCPLALAVRRLFPTARYVEVGGGDCEVYTSRTRCATYWLPREAEMFLHDFDKGLKVRPFRFKMELAELIQESDQWTLST